MSKKTKKILWIIIVIGIILRIIYIIKTPITARQHDVYTINDEGHLGYIYTIYNTGKLPTTNNTQFYHPPLYHMISAGWLKLETLIGIPFDTALEGLQILTLLFSSMILIIVYKLLENIELKDSYKLLIMAVMAVHPTFIILSGSINNDILTIMLIFAIILYLLKWNEKPNLKNTIILAIITGLCVMSKLSGAIMAVPIAIIFISKIISTYKKDKTQLLSLCGLFFVFGIISLPIGLWHPIRNYIMFKQPIGGVLIPGNSLYVGNYNIFQRFIGISFKELRTTFCTIPGDYNIPAYIVKTSALGEFYYNNLLYIPDIIKWLNFIVIIISIYAMIWYYIFHKKTDSKTIDIILIFTYLIHMISYISFNIDYPYVCTMDFRYIVPTIFVGIYCIGKMLEHFSKNNKYKLLTDICECFIVEFCAISVLMIIMI